MRVRVRARARLRARVRVRVGIFLADVPRVHVPQYDVPHTSKQGEP